MLIGAHLASFLQDCFLGTALLAYFLASVILAVTLWEEYKNRVRTGWYDNSKKSWLGELEWDDVKKLMTNDPLADKPVPRWGSRRRVINFISLCMLGLLLWLLGIEGILLLALHFHPQHIEATVHLIGVLGVAGAVAKAIYEWRLKARTENRQKWINELRDTLSTLIENMPLPIYPRIGDEEKRKHEAYFKVHGKLELLMNPSERDHRGLMALIRHIYGHSQLEIDEVPRNELAISNLDPNRREDFEKLKSNTIRLSNVVLKREWERVKHIK